MLRRGDLRLEFSDIFDSFVIVNIPDRMLPDNCSMEYLDALDNWFYLLKSHNCTIMYIDGTYEGLYCTHSHFLNYVDFHIDTDLLVLFLENYLDITYQYILSGPGALCNFQYSFDYYITRLMTSGRLIEYLFLPSFVYQYNLGNPFNINSFLENNNADVYFTKYENNYFDYSLMENIVLDSRNDSVNIYDREKYPILRSE